MCDSKKSAELTDTDLDGATGGKLLEKVALGTVYKRVEVSQAQVHTPGTQVGSGGVIAQPKTKAR